MRLRPLVWLLISLLCFGGAVYFWNLGEKWAADSRSKSPAPEAPAPGSPAAEAPASSNAFAPTSTRFELLSRAGALSPAPLSRSGKFAYRVRNTDQPLKTLVENDRAVLLENALMDTARPLDLGIPTHLRASSEPGAYVVQGFGPIDDAFRTILNAAGAEPVAYIPNNAFLVRAGEDAAARLRQSQGIAAVVPFEPYFKLKGALLALAVEQELLPERTALKALLFSGSVEAVTARLDELGMQYAGEEQSPFGPVLRLRAGGADVGALARLEGVQAIELWTPRTSANDLSRELLAVAETPVAASNYLNLTGTNVLVNVNDSGVDLSHPDLAGRVTVDVPASGFDTNGHGTHVAGIIAGSGKSSTNVINASGSTLPPIPGQFRGVAPGAKIFAITTDLETGPPGDDYLQERAAREGARISNNSWHYQSTRYGLGAASYDAAVRDALPEQVGSWPMVYVFAAGNAGEGDDNGTGGNPDSIQEPATAKNVITVGALELPRDITNEVVKCEGTDTNSCVTNTPWREQTDFRDQVAAYSSRGNTGIGLEGDYGRVKPDLVAPGSFVVSLRSAQWDEAAYYSPTGAQRQIFRDVLVRTNVLWVNAIYIPENAIEVRIQLVPAPRSPEPFPDMPIFVSRTAIPSGNPGAYDFVRTNLVISPPDGAGLGQRGTTWYYGIGNVTGRDVTLTVVSRIVVTNELGNYMDVLQGMNDQLGTLYRYESGSSMAAAQVSGTLALMQEYFQKEGEPQPSPALMKALLINGARSAGNLYDLQPTTPLNFQGWGKPNLKNTLPPGMVPGGTEVGSLHYYDQSVTDALSTGQRRTRFVTVSGAAQSRPLRATLVWTDPPGNPVASLKLVNNLDLVVTNLDTGDVFIGNDIGTGNDFNLPWQTNGPAFFDRANNVENVYLGPILGTNYSVTVIARRVNVNAVTTQNQSVAQDYALVISSGDGEVPDGLTVSDQPFSFDREIYLDVLTNTFTGSAQDVGGLLLNQRVGAPFPLDTSPRVNIANISSLMAPVAGQIAVGTTNQWHFYAFTNATTFTNAAFLTFLPPTLALPRMGARAQELGESTREEADIDMYVSQNPALLRLDPAVIAASDKSIGRGGTETLVFTNSRPGIYYVAIKSEDQQAAEYGFLGVLSLLPFADEDAQGNLRLRGFPSEAFIPDGTPQRPQGAYIFGIAPKALTVRRVVVTNTITHQLMGDLLGSFSHGREVVVLNNHSPNAAVTNVTYIYDDSDEKNVPGARPSDGPGSLMSFGGQPGVGQWMLTQVDNSPDHVGTNRFLTVFLEKQQDLTNGVDATIQAGGCRQDFVTVPIEATNLTVNVALVKGEGPVTLQVCRVGEGGDCVKVPVAVGGATVRVDSTSVPPLNPGIYMIRVCNEGVTEVTVNIRARVFLDLAGVNPMLFTSGQAVPIKDDAVTYATQLVTNESRIARLDVGLRINHPRISDLAITLVSPRGTRVLLSENRGGVSPAGFGYDTLATNVITVSADGGPEAATNVVNTGQTSGELQIDYDFFDKPDHLRVYYEGVRIFDSGMVTNTGRFMVPYGPGSSTSVTIIMNEGGNFDEDTAWFYTLTSAYAKYAYTIFTENTNATITPIKFATPPFTVPNYLGSNNFLVDQIFYQPESSLDRLVGEEADGTWQLELLDNRVGHVVPAPTLLGWQLGIIFENATSTPVPIEHGNTVTNIIPAGRIQQYSVDVPPWAKFATNWLISATAPVNLWFNQNGPVSPQSSVQLLNRATNGVVTLSAASGSPPLVPGQRYYLGVQNLSTNAVTVELQVNFDVTPLTNRVPITDTLLTGLLPRYFSFEVSTNAESVTFELLSLSGDVDLLARRGLPFPDNFSYDYGSFNAGTNDETILIDTNSTPVPITPGTWYLGVFNNDTVDVTYTIVATENLLTPTNPPSTNVAIIDYQWTSNSLCLTWISEPGRTYFVEGVPQITDTNWTRVSPDVLASGATSSWCVPMPSTNSFFRVMVVTSAPPSGVSIGKITPTPTGMLLEWTGPATARFQVQSADSPLGPWTDLGPVIVSPTGNFSYLDDTPQTGAGRFYRLLQLP